MSTSKQVRVRFAPSPTGNLHIGGLRTALFNWLFARHNDGAFLLRIEDTDVERSTKEYRDSILQSFTWVGLEHDEDIIIQSKRITEHRAVAEYLVREGKAYRCFCSQEDVVERYNREHNDNAFVMYDGYCRNRIAQDDDEHKQHVIRFAVPRHIESITFTDVIKGAVSFSLDQCDDFIIVRSGGYPMYNFVVVVDDAFMGITHIIRGEEHIINTPKQLLLYEACGYDIPLFGHLPLILGPSGDKLSKRDGATSVIEYRKEGYLPHALLNYLVRLGWSYGDQEIFSLSELIQFFSLENIGTKGCIFDFEKLAWVNSVYIRSMTPEQIIATIVTDVQPAFVAQCTLWNHDVLCKAITLYQERVKTLKAMVQEIMIVHNGVLDYDQDDMLKWISSDSRRHIDAIVHVCQELPLFDHQTLSHAFKALATSMTIKLVTLLQPVRLALIGKASGPGVFDLLEIIGKEESIARLSSLRAILDYER